MNERSHVSTEPVSPPKDIRELVKRHAKAWAKAGQSNNGACFDPFGSVFVEAARDAEKELLSELARRGIT